MWCVFEGAPYSTTDPRTGLGVTYPPGWLHPFLPELVRMRRAVPVENAVDYVRRIGARRVAAYRTYALGDVLMLIPVLRLLHRTLNLREPIVLLTGDAPWRAIGGDNRSGSVFWFRARSGMGNYGADVHVNLDSCLEADHRGGQESSMHRMEIYARVLGMTTGDAPLVGGGA